MVSYPLLLLSSIFCSSILIIVIYLSLEYESMVQYILTSIPLLVWPSVVCPTTDSMPLLPLLSSYKPLYLVILVFLPLSWFCGPILIVLILFWISFCWTNGWMVECSLKDLLDLLDLVFSLFPVSPCCLFLLPVFFQF